MFHQTLTVAAMIDLRFISDILPIFSIIFKRVKSAKCSLNLPFQTLYFRNKVTHVKYRMCIGSADD